MEQVEGFLEIAEKGFGFLRKIERNFLPGKEDTFVPADLIRSLSLQEGALIEGAALPGNGKHKNFKLTEIDRINHIPFASIDQIEPFQNQVSINPTERFTLTQAPDDIAGKALDLIVPVGKGQRGLIVSPPKAGKTTILKHMAASILQNHPDVMVFVLLVDERPEEVTDFRRALAGARILASSSDQSTSQHLRITRLTMNMATRFTEAHRDVVVLIDSLTRMSRAFNIKSRDNKRTLTGGLGANALALPRKFFGAARNLENGGSLTVIATILVQTGSRMDDIIFHEFKGTGNMDLVLSRKCAEQRLWPAIDIHQSGTRKEEILLPPAEYEKSLQLRKMLAQLDEVSALSRLLDYLERDIS